MKWATKESLHIKVKTQKRKRMLCATFDKYKCINSKVKIVIFQN